MSITHLGKIQHIDIYYDPLQEKDQLLFGDKAESDIGQSIIWLPYSSPESWEKAEHFQKKIGNSMTKSPNKTKMDYDFIIGNSMDLNIYRKAINLLN